MLRDLLNDAASADPPWPFVVGRSGSYGYPEVLAIGRGMREALRDSRAERIGCYVADSPELVILLCAASLAGREVCVISREFSADVVGDLIHRFELSGLVVEESIPGIEIPQLRIEELIRSATEPPGSASDESADSRILILTSGTTGPPKGAVYPWSNLLRQARRKPQLEGSRWLLAYHLNHFAGVQMFAHVVVNRATLIVPDSSDVADAVRAIREHRVEYASGTPTFWRFLTARLSREEARELPLRQITLGGEAVPDVVLEALQRYFPQAQISQVFATTESGSCFSVRDRRQGFPVEMLHRGKDADLQLRIVDGELFVRSRYGMLSYFGEDEQTVPTWRATGDLVEVRGDRVHFVGRCTEVINVGGVKVNPLPVEEVVSRVPGVTLAHAYARPNPITGQIVAVDVVPASGADPTRVEEDVRKACEELEPHARPRLVRIVDSIDMATRNLIRRPS